MDIHVQRLINEHRRHRELSPVTWVDRALELLFFVAKWFLAGIFFGAAYGMFER